MVWYGMVWYGMVWYGMVWYGMVWQGMVWYGKKCSQGVGHFEEDTSMLSPSQYLRQILHPLVLSAYSLLLVCFLLKHSRRVQ